MLARPDVTDIYVNRPGELWIETSGGEIERHDAPALDDATLARLARQIAALSHQGISREHPLLSATLPDGARVQVVAPPATRGPLALAIRKHVSPDLALEDYVAAGAFAETRAPRQPRSLGGRPGAGGAARHGRHPRHARQRGQGAQEHPRFGRHLDRQDHLPERAAARGPGRGTADPDRGHARAQGASRKCGRPARGAQRIGRGAGQRQRPRRRLAAHAARPDHPRRAARRGSLCLPARDQHRPSRDR